MRPPIDRRAVKRKLLGNLKTYIKHADRVEVANTTAALILIGAFVFALGVCVIWTLYRMSTI